MDLCPEKANVFISALAAGFGLIKFANMEEKFGINKDMLKYLLRTMPTIPSKEVSSLRLVEAKYSADVCKDDPEPSGSSIDRPSSERC